MTKPTTKATSDWEPEDWLETDEPATTHGPDEPWAHRGDTGVHDEIVARRARRDAHHRIVTSLAELRRATGMSQTDVAEHWGRPQPKVSRLENDPNRVGVELLASYVSALGGRLAIEVELDDETYRYELA